MMNQPLVDYLYPILIILIGILFPLYAAITAAASRRRLIQFPHKKVKVYQENDTPSMFFHGACIGGNGLSKRWN